MDFCCWVGIGQKPRIIREPTRAYDIPFDLVLACLRRLCDGASHAGFDIFDMNSLRIDKSKVSAVGGYRTARDRIVGGIDGELPKFDLQRRPTGGLLVLRKPEDNGSQGKE